MPIMLAIIPYALVMMPKMGSITPLQDFQVRRMMPTASVLMPKSATNHLRLTKGMETKAGKFGNSLDFAAKFQQPIVLNIVEIFPFLFFFSFF